MLSLVVARARNGAIGRAGEIPWRAPEDLRAFQRETQGGAIIMGRRTWESLPKRPLPGRLNCVVTRRGAEAELVCDSVPAALAACQEAGHTRIYGIGGARIYEALLPVAHRLLVTEVDMEVPDADTFFPAFDEGAWEEIASVPLRAEGPACTLRELLRR